MKTLLTVFLLTAAPLLLCAESSAGGGPLSVIEKVINLPNAVSAKDAVEALGLPPAVGELRGPAMQGRLQSELPGASGFSFTISIDRAGNFSELRSAASSVKDLESTCTPKEAVFSRFPGLRKRYYFVYLGANPPKIDDFEVTLPGGNLLVSFSAANCLEGFVFTR